MASQRTKLVTTERYPTELRISLGRLMCIGHVSLVWFFVWMFVSIRSIKGSFVKRLITSILFFQLGNTDISVEKIAYEDGTTKCRLVM